MVKSPLFDPAKATEEMWSVAPPELVTVTFLGAVVVPCVIAPKETLVVDRDTAGFVDGAGVAVPLSWIICEEFGASSVMVMIAGTLSGSYGSEGQSQHAACVRRIGAGCAAVGHGEVAGIVAGQGHRRNVEWGVTRVGDGGHERAAGRALGRCREGDRIWRHGNRGSGGWRSAAYAAQLYRLRTAGRIIGDGQRGLLRAGVRGCEGDADGTEFCRRKDGGDLTGVGLGELRWIGAAERDGCHAESCRSRGPADNSVEAAGYSQRGCLHRG